MTTLLSEDEIGSALEALDGWRHQGQALTRTLRMPTFPAAVALVTEVAEVAEQINHHPDIDIRWRTLVFTCSTHSHGGVTGLDVEMARAINRLAAASSDKPAQ